MANGSDRRECMHEVISVPAAVFNRRTQGYNGQGDFFHLCG